jgi:hypothetical protein
VVGKNYGRGASYLERSRRYFNCDNLVALVALVALVVDPAGTSTPVSKYDSPGRFVLDHKETA